MIEKVMKLYDLEAESPYLGHLVLLSLLVDLMEEGLPELDAVYQKAWDNLPDHLLFAFCEMHGIIV